ncbi:cupin domain-containing protein [Kitasatospora sp. NPDC058162]|uniref:cupin domain-containing protein n=1 Tax=Kitasatospora sp. NPDC058162 TaxID=3346362 RepID=UPI0036DDC3E8
MTVFDSAIPPVPVALPAGGGRPLTVLGNPWSVKLSGGQTAGTLAVIEGTFAPGTGAPPHLHRGHEECFYVLGGEFRFRAGEETVEAGAGGFFYVPRGAAHGFENIGDGPGRLLGLITPAGYEEYFIEVGSQPPGPPDFAALQAIFAKYDQELVQGP